MEIVSFEPSHLTELFKQKAHAAIASRMTIENVEAIAQQDSYSVVHQGRVLLVGGVVRHWPTRGEAWALIDQDCRRDFIGVFNCARRWLNDYRIRRLEALIDYEFEAGHRWITALGFKLEAPRLECYRADGGDSSMYVRIEHGC